MLAGNCSKLKFSTNQSVYESDVPMHIQFRNSKVGNKVSKPMNTRRLTLKNSREMSERFNSSLGFSSKVWEGPKTHNKNMNKDRKAREALQEFGNESSYTDTIPKKDHTKSLSFVNSRKMRVKKFAGIASQERKKSCQRAFASSNGFQMIREIGNLEDMRKTSIRPQRSGCRQRSIGQVKAQSMQGFELD